MEEKAKVNPEIKKIVKSGKARIHRAIVKEKLIEEHPEILEEENRKKLARENRIKENAIKKEQEKEHILRKRAERRNGEAYLTELKESKSLQTNKYIEIANVSEEFKDKIHKAMVIKRFDKNNNVFAFKSILVVKFAKYINIPTIINVVDGNVDLYEKVAEETLINTIKECESSWMKENGM